MNITIPVGIKGVDMEDLINKQIEETKEYEIAKMEKEMEEDPRYWLFTAVDYLDKANELLWNKGDNANRDLVLKALLNAKRALKLLEE